MTDPASPASPAAPASITVRPARAEDLPRAAELFGELDRFQARWRVFDPRSTLQDEAESRYGAALDSTDARLMVAEVGGEIVGIAHGHLGQISSISDEVVLEVENVFVLPSHRRRGVAEALVRALGGFAHDRGVRRMALKTYSQNEHAMRFWEVLGFRPRWTQMTANVEEVRPPDR